MNALDNEQLDKMSLKELWERRRQIQQWQKVCKLINHRPNEHEVNPQVALPSYRDLISNRIRALREKLD